MNQSDMVANNSTCIQGMTVHSCELRLERCTIQANGTERREFLCGASGGPDYGYVLGVSGEDLSPMIAICNSCPIPDALEGRRSCLNLVPVRRFSGGKRHLSVIQSRVQTSESTEPGEPPALDTFFPCRWFYPLYGQNQPCNTTLCQSCLHWFPRPPRELIPGYWPQTQKMLRVVNGEESTTGRPTGFTPASKPSPPGTWWQRLLQKIHL
jgi:hypothetical protein